VADDGGDPARHRALVQQLVEQSKVVAFIYMAAPLSGQAALPYLLQKGVAAIGTEGGSSWVNESPIYFPQMSSFDFLAPVFAGPVAQEALKAGKKKLALFNCEFSACKPVLTADAFRKAGLDVVHEATASITQPDYTAECLAARNAGAEIVFPQFTPDGIIRMAESCRNVGFEPLYAFEAQTMSPLFLQRPEFEGAIFSSPVAPFFLDLPATVEFRAAMARYAPKEEVNVSTSLGWVSAKLFERAVTRATNPAVTTADVLSGLRSVKGDDLGGITYPLTFDSGAPDNATHEQSCWWTIRISAGRWTTPDNGQRRCGP
jgi:branched-chain amino acid transport system substrate-binding protein